MLDRITGMRVFARAANAGRLSAAARHLGLSPAMATKHVDASEAHLGSSCPPQHPKTKLTAAGAVTSRLACASCRKSTKPRPA